MTQNNKRANIIDGAGDQTHSGVITDRQAAQLNIKQKEHKMTQTTREQQHQAVIDKLADRRIKITPFGHIEVALNPFAQEYEVLESEWESASQEAKLMILKRLVKEDDSRDDITDGDLEYKITDWDYAD